MSADSLPPPIGRTSDDKQSPSKIRKTTPIREPVKLTLVVLGLALILIALPTAQHLNINLAAIILIGAGTTLLVLSWSLLRVRRHWTHFLLLCGSLCLMAICAAWLASYHIFNPLGEGAGFVLFPMFLLCGAVALPASAICFVSAVVVLFVKTDSTGTLKEDGEQKMPRRIPQLVGGSLVGAALIILFVTVYPRVSPALLMHEIDADTVTITGYQKEASGKLVIPQDIEDRPVTRIGAMAFSNCTSLTSITIPDGVTSIGNDAFFMCPNLTSITIGDGVTSIGDGAFGNCSSLTTIEVGAGNKNFTDVNGVLFNAEKAVLLTHPEGKTGDNYDIPDSVTRIGATAFANCTSLTSITIPDSVTSIGNWAFYQCTRLSAVTFLGDAPKAGEEVFTKAPSTIYRNPEAKNWGETWGGRPVKLISEKP